MDASPSRIGKWSSEMSISGIQSLQVASLVALAVNFGPNMVSEVISDHLIILKMAVYTT